MDRQRKGKPSMKKRLFALILCLALCLSAVPAAAAEKENDPKITAEDHFSAAVSERPGLESAKEAAPDLEPDGFGMRRQAGDTNMMPSSSAPRVSFSSFTQLKSLCSKTYSEETVALCTMESGEFVFSQNLTIPKNLDVVTGIKESSTNSYQTVDVSAQIPGGVTVTLQGQLYAESLTVDGKMIVEANAEISGYHECCLTVNGSIENRGRIYADIITGLKFIEQKSFSTSYVSVRQTCVSFDELINLLDYNDHNYGIGVTYSLDCRASIDFSENVTVPSNTYLYLWKGGTVRSGRRLTVKGSLNVESLTSSANLTIAGELKNSGTIYLSNYEGNCGRLKLQKGGSYIGSGRLMLHAYGGTLDVADMLPGFDLSQFTTSTNGSYTQLKLSNYTEPWEDEEISSFQELKEMVESGSDDDIMTYSGPNPLVIEEDLTLNFAQDMHIYPTDVVVPEGVTFTVPSFFSCHNLTVHGTMNVYSSITTGHREQTDFSRANPNTVIVDGELNLYGEDYGSFYYPATLATEYLYGEENIHRLGEGNMVYIIRPVESDEAIRELLYEAQNGYREWKEYCPSIYSDFTLPSDLVIPHGCSLDLYDGTFTVPEGVTLTIYGGMELRGGTLNVQGTLINESEITIYEENGEQIRLRDDSCYDGSGLINLWSTSPDTLLPGFDLSAYYVYYGSSNKVVLTRSKEAYDRVAAGNEKPEEIYYEATAPITYHQTEARTMLQYVNDFRTGDQAFYNGSSGETVSLVGQLQPLEYSYSLEEIAMQRAAEIAVQYLGDHSRPNGHPWSSLMSSDGKYSHGENMGASTQPSVYDFYISLREDDLDYSKQGHRRNMLGSYYKYMGVGYTEYCGLGFLVQEFGIDTGVGEVHPAVDGTVVTVIEVASGNVYRYDNVKAEPETLSLAPGGSADFPSVSASLFVVADFFLNTDSPTAVLTPSWEVEDSGIAEIRDGKICSVAEGETALTATVFEQEVRVPVIVSSSGVSAPKITEQPKSLSLTLGADAVLHAAAEGQALNYQWYYRVKSGADWKALTSSSSQTDTLHFKAHANLNNCDFRCVISNISGSVTSKTVHLTISQKMNKSSLLLPYFRTGTLKLQQAAGSDAYTYWSSSDPSILAVRPGGVLKPKKFGVVTVTAAAGDGRVTASCKVSVVFSDVANKSDYYFNHVYWALDNGITNGYSSGTYAGKFGVGLTCTREDMMTFLWRLAGKPEPQTTKNPFPDVDSSAYYYKAVLWGVEQGITNGYSSGPNAGKFGVGITCDREQAMTFLWRQPLL